MAQDAISAPEDSSSAAVLQVRQCIPPDWPLVHHSRLVRCGGMSWHVQELGAGPIVVLLHGTGASTHSWRDVATELAQTYRVVMFDLPGHGFTGRPRNAQMSLPAITRLIANLLKQLNVTPDTLVGHSAGAAIACQLAIDGLVDVKKVVSVNGALLPFDGVAGQLFGPIANMLAVNPMVPKLVSWRARNSNVVSRLLDDTGSVIDAEGKGYYSQLLRTPDHVAGALCMMARWDLIPLSRQLSKLDGRLHLIVGGNDKTVPPMQSREVSQQVKGATLTELSGLGHLAHEEDPQGTCKALTDIVKLIDIDKAGHGNGLSASPRDF